MTGPLTARAMRSALALLLCLTMAGGLVIGSMPVSAQGNDDITLPGFDPLPAEAELLGYASGELDGSGIATLIVERIVINPLESLDPVAGPFVLIVESGSMVYEDDLGLEAEVGAGASQFFAPGEGDTLSNAGEERAVVLRIALITDAAIDGAPGPEDGGSGGDTEDDGDGPGEDTPVRPRDDDSGSTAPGGGVNALIFQDAVAPDEVVISLDDDGFSPDEATIANGGVLVIENAGDVDCRFVIDPLEIEIDLAAGDIEQVTIDVPAGDYDWTCLDERGDSLGDGILTVVDEGGTSTNDTTDTETTPEPDETVTPDDSLELPTGTLLQASISLDGASELFGASLILEPGGTLNLTGVDGALGVTVAGGDLTVTREGRSPATLRDGRSVTLPDGMSAELSNTGDTPISIIFAGVTGSSIASDSDAGSDATETPEPTDDDSGTDNGSTIGSDEGGIYAFFPDDDAMAELGLIPSWNAFTDVTDPASNTFWMADSESADENFTDWGWVQSTALRYDSAGEETDFGIIDVFGITVDEFSDESGAAEFFSYIERDPTGESTDFLDGVADVNGAIEFDLGGSDVSIVITAVHAGPYVITVFATGTDLDAQDLIHEVWSIMFGAVG